MYFNFYKTVNLFMKNARFIINLYKIGIQAFYRLEYLLKSMKWIGKIQSSFILDFIT